MRAARVLTIGGAAGSLLAGRSRVAAVASGVALLAGSLCTRLGVFEAGQASARDPRYTVVPQRERVDRGERVRAGPDGGARAAHGRACRRRLSEILPTSPAGTEKPRPAGRRRAGALAQAGGGQPTLIMSFGLRTNFLAAPESKSL